MEDLLSEAIDRMLSGGAEFCDARHQRIDQSSIKVVDGSVRVMRGSRLEGTCFRARIGGRWGYSTSVSSDRQALLKACLLAPRHARATGHAGCPIPPRPSRKVRHEAAVRLHPMKVPIEEKLERTKEAERAQVVDDRVVNTNADYADETKRVTLMNSFGEEMHWEEVRCRLFVMSVALENGRAESYYDILGGTEGLEMLKGRDLLDFGGNCGREAVRMLGAGRAPSGLMTVITDPANTGTLAHEVIGHASEADEVVKRRSFLSGAIGTRVGSDLVTMVDDGTLEGGYGTIPFDDEGTASSRTTVIENGIYSGYLHNLETAAEMGASPTGNGRAQDFSRRVWVRMTNTFFEPGDWTLEEMIEEVDFGLLADKSISGMEDPVGGGFEAQVLRGHLIERGEIKGLVRSFALTGHSIDILRTTDAVSDDLRFEGGSLCGKGVEDFVPVSVGGPYCRSKIIVGGD